MAVTNLNWNGFDGVKNCNGFVPGYSDWQERYYKALKEEK